MSSPADPVRARRRQVATWARRMNRLGFVLTGVAIGAFLYGFFTDFDAFTVTVVVAALVVGLAVLAVSMVLTSGIRLAEKEDRSRGV